MFKEISYEKIKSKFMRTEYANVVVQLPDGGLGAGQICIPRGAQLGLYRNRSVPVALRLLDGTYYARPLLKRGRVLEIEREVY